ncbi:serine/threonine kinase [Pseudocercospora fijiensis CIRAD86]|uniref:non-specific serine/threonine protein kinase n=1 Tax=Pseudocercospora fijiensis (strain CIRAD86) TaxID=383855 RepID=M2YM54_PSEFD|nr:serine/threonine kinase [Pseudocercospora fijiensis CIRAD86]EME78805.1 serine/threonine kinase [Pseudocercospora fijiensis CIRAD86]
MGMPTRKQTQPVTHASQNDIVQGLVPPYQPRFASVSNHGVIHRGEERPTSLLQFKELDFEIIEDDEVLDEEATDGFDEGAYYPVSIGQVFDARYQVVGKLGYGATSTVWLARGIQKHSFVTLKIYTRHPDNEDEVKMYQYLSTCKTASHPGSSCIRTAFETFEIPRSGGPHHGIVQIPLWDSIENLVARNGTHQASAELLKPLSRYVFLALDYIHTECHVIHTDIKADNILQTIEDDSILQSFVQAGLGHPSPRKSVGDKTVYLSRSFDLPKTFGNPVLSDFGAAVRGDIEHDVFVQPEAYRSPEVAMEMEWSYPIDIWNVGCMVSRKDKELFVQFIRSMLQWKPEDRKTARELLEDPWLNGTG